MNAYMSQYQNTQILTASSEQILIMLYAGAINFVRQAAQAIEQNDRHMKAEKISKTLAIISELSGTLDFETGGEIADNLDALYSFMIRELTTANLRNDAKRLHVVETLLVSLRETWVEAIEKNCTQEQQENPAQTENSSNSTAEYRGLNSATI